MTSWTSFYGWARVPQRDLILTAGRVFPAPLGWRARRFPLLQQWLGLEEALQSNHTSGLSSTIHTILSNIPYFSIVILYKYAAAMEPHFMVRTAQYSQYRGNCSLATCTVRAVQTNTVQILFRQIRVTCSKFDIAPFNASLRLPLKYHDSALVPH